MMRFDGQNPDEIALRLAHIALEAGRVLRGMESALVDKRIKDDGTPTTAADLAAEELIIQRLNEDWEWTLSQLRSIRIDLAVRGHDGGEER